MLGNPSKVDSFTLLWLVAKDLKFKGKKLGAYLNVTGFGKTGLIAGLVKIDFFPEKSSSTAYAKYERFT